MVRVILGSDLEDTGEHDVLALTLGQLKDELGEAEPWLLNHQVRWFVNGQDAELLEGDATPVDEEDTVLVTSW